MNETTSFDHIKSTAEWHAEEIKRREGTSFFDDTSFFSTSPRNTAIAYETHHSYGYGEILNELPSYLDLAIA